MDMDDALMSDTAAPQGSAPQKGWYAKRIVLLVGQCVLLLAIGGALLWFFWNYVVYGYGSPPEELWNAYLVSAFITGVTVIGCGVMVLLWARQNKTLRAFESQLTDRENDLTSTVLDTSLPIAFDGYTVRVNAFTHVHEIPLGDIFWIDVRIVVGNRGGRTLTTLVYLRDGRCFGAGCSPRNGAGIMAQAERIQQANPTILLSMYTREEHLRCKKQYKAYRKQLKRGIS